MKLNILEIVVVCVIFSTNRRQNDDVVLFVHGLVATTTTTTRSIRQQQPWWLMIPKNNECGCTSSTSTMRMMNSFNSIHHQRWRRTGNIDSTSSSSTTTTTALFALPSQSQSQQPKALASEGDWTAYIDMQNTGFIYYFNAQTGESLWEPPTSTFPPLQMDESTKRTVIAKQEAYIQSQQTQTLGQSQQSQSQQKSSTATTAKTSSSTPTSTSSNNNKVEKDWFASILDRQPSSTTTASTTTAATTRQEETTSASTTSSGAKKDPKRGGVAPASTASTAATTGDETTSGGGGGFLGTLFKKNVPTSITASTATPTTSTTTATTTLSDADDDMEKKEKKDGGGMFSTMINGWANTIAAPTTTTTTTASLSSPSSIDTSPPTTAKPPETTKVSKEDAVVVDDQDVVVEDETNLLSSIWGQFTPDIGTSTQPITVQMASHIMPHPDKILWGGEDAVFTKGRIFGIFDGVTSANKTIGQALYSRTLANEMKRKILPAIANYGMTIPELTASLTECVVIADKVATGASTAIVASISQDGYLRVLNLGDSTCIVIRKNEVVKQTKDRNHFRECPYQLSKDSPDAPREGTRLTFPLKRGDIIVMASDGVFDNLSNDQVADVVQKEMATKQSSSTTTVSGLTTLAKRIVEVSRKVSLDKTALTPFSIVAKRYNDPAYPDGLGGKVDDVSCIVVSYN